MLYEYALDPNIVAKSHDPQDAQFLLQNFGLDAGRIVARYPSSWKRCVWDAVTADSNSQSNDIQKTKIEVLVQHLSSTFAKRPGSDWVESDGWLVNTRRENERKSFHMILVRGHCDGQTNIHGFEDIKAGSVDNWAVPNSLEVVRTAQEMANAIAPMLRMAQRIWFIDPYFRADQPRFLRPLRAFLEHTRFEQNPEIQIHTKLKTDKNSNTDDWSDIRSQGLEHLPKIVPRGHSMTLRCWTERDDGQKLHNRYVLTDVGSVMFGNGLDDGGTHTSATDTLARLGDESHRALFREYDEANPAFELKGDVDIQGTARG